MFGSRGTGKSTLLESLFRGKSTLWIDLLDEDQARRFLVRPQLLEEMVHGHKETDWVVIDEVQRAPGLLNHVHRLIEKRQTKFALTGSSARKLKRGAANLLAGRAFLNHLYPLTSMELGADFSLDAVLQWGTLPKIFQLSSELEKREFLKTYCNTYLKEEIREEQVVRHLEPFLRFLEVAAQCNAEPINFSKMGRDAGCDPKGVERYYQILEDTLIGCFLPAYHRSVRKRQSQRSKFYFFDTGIKRGLDGTLQVPLLPRTSEYGRAFEHFFVLECIRLNNYFRTDYRFSYLRTKDDLEVDLVVERPGKTPVLIEVKSSDRVDEKDFSHLKTLRRDMDPCELWVVSREEVARKTSEMDFVPWQTAINWLFNPHPLAGKTPEQRGETF